MKKISVFVAIIICLTTTPNAMAAQKIHSLEIGPEISDFSFKQPGLLVKDSGVFYGAYGIYTFRPQADNWVTRVVDVFEAEVHYGTGATSYKNAATKYHVTDYLVEPRFLVGKEFSPGWATITPYAGFGYRYFLRGVSTGDGLVDDIYHYYYLPLGINVGKEFTSGWKIGVNLEYDHLLRGNYKAPLSDVNNSTTTYTDLKNTHKSGKGFRASIEVEKNIGCVSLVLKPYLRYWNIGSSDITTFYSNNNPSSHQETKVTAHEIGMSLAIKF